MTQESLRNRGSVEIRASIKLSLVNLTGDGLSKIGADNRLTGGGNYELSQAWSKSIHEHPTSPDGIIYRSRHDPDRACVAIFDRCQSQLNSNVQGHLFSNPLRPKLMEILEHYEFGLD